MGDDQTEVAIEKLSLQLSKNEKKSSWANFTPRHLKLHLAKQIINYTVPKLNRLIPTRKPRCIVSKIIDHSFMDITRMLCEGQKDKKKPLFGDDNFIRLVDATRRTLLFMAEEDPYYRIWLEILLLSLYLNVKNNAPGLEIAEKIFTEKRYVL